MRISVTRLPALVADNGPVAGLDELDRAALLGAVLW